MNIVEQTKHFDQFTEQMRNVMLRKGNDYSNEDRLSNFKLAGNICGLSAKQNCLSLIATKVARLGVLVSSNKEAENESLRDSILDLANYALLLDMIIEDEQPKEL